MQKIYKLPTLFFLLLNFLNVANAQLLEPTYTSVIHNTETYSQLEVIGKVDGTTYSLVNLQDHRADFWVKDFYYVYFEGGKHQVVKNLSEASSLNVVDRLSNYKLRNVASFQLKNRTLNIEAKSDQSKKDGEESFHARFVDSQTMDYITEEPLEIDLYKLDESVDKNLHLTKKFNLSADSTSLIVSSYAYSFSDNIKASKPYNINVRVFDLNTMELKAESNVETNVDKQFYTFSKSTLTTKNEIIIGFQRKDYSFNRASLIEYYYETGPEIDDFIFYSGELNTNDFERNGVTVFQKGRATYDKRIIFESNSIQLFVLFNELMDVDKNNTILLPGFEVFTLNTDFEEIGKSEIVSTPTQANLINPASKGILRKLPEYQSTSRRLKICDIKKLPNGNWFINAEAPSDIPSDANKVFECIVTASIGKEVNENTYIRILPNPKKSYLSTLGSDYSTQIVNNDVYYIMNDTKLNIEKIKNTDDQLNNGHLMGKTIPTTNDDKQYYYYELKGDNIIRIDKISEKGKVTHAFVTNIKNDKKYLPNPMNTWIDDNGILYVQGLIDYVPKWDNYTDFEFIMLDLNKME